MSQVASVRKPRGWRPKAGALVAILVGVFVALSVGRRPVPTKLPVPNGYVDLVRAGKLVDGAWPGQGDLMKAAIPEIRAFVEANRPTLDLARAGLGRECLVPLENSQDGLARHMEDLSPIRAVGRLLMGEARVAEADGRVLDAARADLDALALGQAATQGGVVIDHSVGAAVQWLAVIELRKLRDRLPTDQIPAILRELESLDKRRVPLKAVMARERAWLDGAYNPIMRTMLDLSGVQKTAMAASMKAIQQQHERVERDLRFLMAALAIHAYHEDKHAWPRSIRDLVPAYLSAIPIDPRTGQPLAYPANEAGELTDDLGSIGRPDGEVKPRP